MTRGAYIVLTVSLVTMLLRFLPFWIFGGRKETPPYIMYLGKVLPYAIMGMLIIYCLRGVSFAGGSRGIPELISCAVVVLAHVWKRSTLLSILSGTLCYMLLVQLVF